LGTLESKCGRDDRNVLTQGSLTNPVATARGSVT